MNGRVFFSFLTFTLLVAGVSIYKTRKQNAQNAVSFFLGNRSLGFWVIGSSLFLTNMSSNQFIGENEFVYTTDMSVMCWGMSSILAMLLVAEFLMPAYLKIGAVTTPDFLGKRFDGQTKRMVSVFFLLSYIINLIPTVLYGCSVAINGIFHLEERLGINYFSAIRLLVICIGVIGGLYSLLGGLKAITMSDLIQGVGMLVGGVLITWYGFDKLGDGHILNGIKVVVRENKAHLNAIGGKHDVIPFGTLFTGMLLINIYYWGMEQYIVQDVLASKSLAICQKGLSLACVGKLFAPLLLNIPGLIALHLYPHIENTATVFPMLVSDILPPVVAGLIAAIVFGGALSTFNAGLNSLGTLFVMNIYRPWQVSKHKEIDEKQILRKGKQFQLIVILLAMCFSPYIMYFGGGFYNYLQKASSFFSVPVFTVMLIGFITKKVPPVAVKIGFVFFIVTYTASQFLLNVSMHYLHVLGILFIATVMLMLVIGRLHPLAVPYVMDNSAVVSLKPWKHRHWFFVVLLLLMVGVFIVFSPLGLAK